MNIRYKYYRNVEDEIICKTLFLLIIHGQYLEVKNLFEKSLSKY